MSVPPPTIDQPLRGSALSRRTAVKAAGVAAGAAALAVAFPNAAAAAPTVTSRPAAVAPRPRAEDPTAADATPVPVSLIADPGFNYSALTALGMAGYQLTEVGEVLTATSAVAQAEAVATRTDTADPSAVFSATAQAYTAQFRATGDRVAGRVAAAKKCDDRTTVASCSLRASQYYAQSLYYVLGSSAPADEPAIFASSKDNWLRFLANGPADVSQLRVPYAGSTLPAWILRPKGAKGRRPTIILTNGSDGQSADLWSWGAAAALDRGWNAVIYEGPGQGATLFEKGITFTSSWETVVTPIVDALVRRPEVDSKRLVLTGLSMGGNLVARAAASEKRLAAVVCEPGVVSPWNGFPASIRSLYVPKNATATNDNWQKNIVANASKLPSSIRFTLAKRFEPFSAEQLAAGRQGQFMQDFFTPATVLNEMDVTAVLPQINCATLVLDYEGEQFYPGQAQTMFSLLTGSKITDLITLTAADGAQLHCSPMAPQHHNEVIFDWLHRRVGLR